MRSCIFVRPEPGHPSVTPPTRVPVRVSVLRGVTAVAEATVSHQCPGTYGCLAQGRGGTTRVAGRSEQWATRREGVL